MGRLIDPGDLGNLAFSRRLAAMSAMCCLGLTSFMRLPSLKITCSGDLRG